MGRKIRLGRARSKLKKSAVSLSLSSFESFCSNASKVQSLVGGEQVGCGKERERTVCEENFFFHFKSLVQLILLCDLTTRTPSIFF